MGRKPAFPLFCHLSCSVSCELLFVLLMSLYSWLNHLVIGNPIGLFPVRFNLNAFFSTFIVCLSVSVSVAKLFGCR